MKTIMEFDWINIPFELDGLTPKDIEETFEDPFAIKLLPDGGYGEEDARYINLGKSVRNQCIFSVFWTDGKRYRMICGRKMTPNEENLYERLNAAAL